MTDADHIELDDLRATMLGELARINYEISVLAADADVIKSDLRRLPLGDYTVHGKPAVRIAPTRRFDVAIGLTLVPPELRPQCYVNTLDPKQIKRFLSPALVNLAMVTTGEPQVRLL